MVNLENVLTAASILLRPGLTCLQDLYYPHDDELHILYKTIKKQKLI